MIIPSTMSAGRKARRQHIGAILGPGARPFFSPNIFTSVLRVHSAGIHWRRILDEKYQIHDGTQGLQPDDSRPHGQELSVKIKRRSR